MASEDASGGACQSCGTEDVSRAAQTASRGLAGLPGAATAFLTTAFGQVPSLLCAACFIAALSQANAAIHTDQRTRGLI